jgi:hypothetical protein
MVPALYKELFPKHGLAFSELAFSELAFSELAFGLVLRKAFEKTV